MTQCTYCKEKRGKRLCPALKDQICPVCCGTHRMIRIQCPPDCPHLKSGETYQKQRREEKALATGKDYLSERWTHLKDQNAMMMMGLIERLIYLYRRLKGDITDRAVLSALEQLPLHLSPIEVVTTGPHPLALFLAGRIKKDEAFKTFRELPRERIEKLIKNLDNMAKKRTGNDADSTSYLEFIATYFDAVLSEREILKEQEEMADSDPSKGEGPSGGIIVP